MRLLKKLQLPGDPSLAVRGVRTISMHAQADAYNQLSQSAGVKPMPPCNEPDCLCWMLHKELEQREDDK